MAGYYVLEKKSVFSTEYLRVDSRGNVQWVDEAPLASHFPIDKAKLILQWARRKSSLFDTVRLRNC